ncbi:16S rRNA (guanine(966)-N(2))-methyltransferase RsmD [Sneathiella sp. P13V-1]|uniref:16S rRNA (guanine(966)-N(2))-methyltransferase RsmD n=1 Tax=Sneathiella sp. P13V-1 TaxID=2697366 RepID=UPI00187BAFF2|nr:16S rRNA (guanine(966)-N(2))-methyltransferase RsmD [Sneathiella sp. P13V-1]MBE7638504.1 16S rRNA (guanine(966)-N(2))-methyltransferase RsmD [Sneathiella sp. P13V-1]
MRIVGGEARGKKLLLPEDKRVRPTADRTREALFNILGHGDNYRTDNGPLPRGARVLDAFCGTGALGLEALSRGASDVVFMDNHHDSLKLTKQNIALLGAQRQTMVLNKDATKCGRGGPPADLLLMDPPYNMDLAAPALQNLLETNWLKEGSIAVVELAAKEKFTAPDQFELLDERKYGAAKLIFLKVVA